MTTHFQWPHGKCLQVRGWVNEFNGVVLWHVTRLFQTLGLTSNQTELETKSQWFQVRFLRLKVRWPRYQAKFYLSNDAVVAVDDGYDDVVIVVTALAHVVNKMLAHRHLWTKKGLGRGWVEGWGTIWGRILERGLWGRLSFWRTYPKIRGTLHFVLQFAGIHAQNGAYP